MEIYSIQSGESPTLQAARQERQGVLKSWQDQIRKYSTRHTLDTCYNYKDHKNRIKSEFLDNYGEVIFNLPLIFLSGSIHLHAVFCRHFRKEPARFPKRKNIRKTEFRKEETGGKKWKEWKKLNG